MHAISTTLKLDVPNAVIKANIEAPFQSRYLDLLNQQTEAEERHQGSDWTQHSLNREIREIADRRWEVERLREQIGSSAANGFELFLQPNRQDLTNLERRLTGFDTTVSQAGERNQLDLNTAREIARRDDLFREQERTLTEAVRAGQRRREEPVAAIDVTRERHEITDQLQQAQQLLETLLNRTGNEGVHPQAMQTRLERLIEEINRDQGIIQRLNRNIARITGQAEGLFQSGSNEAPPAYTLPPGYRTAETNNPPSPTPAGAAAAQARTSQHQSRRVHPQLVAETAPATASRASMK